MPSLSNCFHIGVGFYSLMSWVVLIYWNLLLAAVSALSFSTIPACLATPQVCPRVHHLSTVDYSYVSSSIIETLVFDFRARKRALRVQEYDIATIFLIGNQATIFLVGNQNFGRAVLIACILAAWMDALPESIPLYVLFWDTATRQCLSVFGPTV